MTYTYSKCFCSCDFIRLTMRITCARNYLCQKPDAANPRQVDAVVRHDPEKHTEQLVFEAFPDLVML